MNVPINTETLGQFADLISQADALIVAIAFRVRVADQISPTSIRSIR